MPRTRSTGPSRRWRQSATAPCRKGRERRRRDRRAAGARPPGRRRALRRAGPDRYRQVGAGEDRKAASLIGAAASCGSFGARDLGPDREGLRPDGWVLGGGEVIAVEMEEVVDLIVGGEEPLHLPG